nr:hypothetical protein [uncultured Flavobacterium sp.]
MKKIYLPILFGLMIWALFDQVSEKQHVIIQIIVVILFFYAMMKLMAKTPDNKK